MPGRGSLSILAQPSEDIFNIDDGVVDEFTRGDRQSPERHRIDRQPKCLENKSRHDNGQRNGC